MNAAELQQQLFSSIKSKIPEHISAPEEIARMLDVSVDSAYRRMRGEKTISLDELQILCTHFKISLDQMMGIQTDAFMFQGKILDAQTFRFDAYLTNVMHNMAYFKSFKQTDFFYLCKDIPLFHHFHSREFAAFKYYFWMSTLVGFPDFKNKKVNFAEYPDACYETSKKILNIYYSMNTNELWTLESLNSTIRQLDYYIECKMFESNKDALRVYEAVEQFFDHLEKQAELGYRFKYDDPEKKPLGKFDMYFNEIVLPDNSMIVLMDGAKLVLMPHTAINFMTTTDVVFCENYYRYSQNLMKRSTLISQASEKERSRFFRIMRDKLHHRKIAMKL